MTRPTEVLIHELATELAPVRRVPRLRSVVALALAIGGASGAAWLGFAGPQFAAHPPERMPYLIALLATTVVAALGGVCAAGASYVPGRERVERVGMLLLCGGPIAALAIALWSVAGGIAFGPVGSEWLSWGATCAAGTALLAIPCAAALVHFARRGAPERPALSLALGGAAAATLAGVAVQLACSSCDLAHAAIFHVALPVALGALGASALLVTTAPQRREAKRS